jgi:hypothetical protein
MGLMKTLRWLVAGIVVGVIAVAFRDFERGEWLRPTLPRRTSEPDEREPILGYDGMDQETLLEWLEDSDLDSPTVEEMIRYEEDHLSREPVLSRLEEILAG